MKRKYIKQDKVVDITPITLSEFDNNLKILTKKRFNKKDTNSNKSDKIK